MMVWKTDTWRREGGREGVSERADSYRKMRQQERREDERTEKKERKIERKWWWVEQ